MSVSDINWGTISLTNGSTTVTGSGTTWLVDDLREGDTFVLIVGGEDRQGPIVASVQSDTSLTLVTPWTGATLTGVAYRLRYQWDSSRVSAMVRRLVDLLGNGVLQSLSGLAIANNKLIKGVGVNTLDLQDFAAWAQVMLALPGAANKLPYLNAANTAALTDLTAKGRSILARTDNAGVLEEIGAQPADSDLTAIAALTTTAFGRGLLTLANAAALRTAASAINKAGDTGIGPLIGSTLDFQTIMSGNYDRFGNFRIQSPRSSGTPGNTNYSGSYEAWIGNNSLGFAMSTAERVGTETLVILNVRGGGNQAYFEFVQNGALRVPGALSKGSGTFLIDHPLDPLNKDLAHGFVEAPRYDLIYRGVVQLGEGRAIVDIDAASNMTEGTFGALTINAVVTSLQNQDGFARLRPGAITGGKFEIICEDDTCTDHVSWVVIAERNDAFVKSELDPNTDSDGRFVPERDKPE